MSAGPDRVTVARNADSGLWEWRYNANGRPVAQSVHGYARREHALHGLYLATGIRLDVPKGWRGTEDEPILRPKVRRYLRPLNIVAAVIDAPLLRRAYARRRHTRGD